MRVCSADNRHGADEVWEEVGKKKPEPVATPAVDARPAITNRGAGRGRGGARGGATRPASAAPSGSTRVTGHFAFFLLNDLICAVCFFFLHAGAPAAESEAAAASAQEGEPPAWGERDSNRGGRGRGSFAARYVCLHILYS